MADHQTQASLEDQLRNMILTNVTIGSPDPVRGHVHSQHHNPRGRGRGRGRARPYGDRGGWNGPSRGEHQHQVAPSVPLQHNMAPSQAPRILPQPYDPNRAMSNPRQADHHTMPHVQNRYQNYQPRGRANPSMRGGHAGFQQRPVSDTTLQDAYLDRLAMQEIPNAEITREEFQEKEAFRLELEKICHEASIKEYEADLASIRLVMFGSLASGFATKGSDMDLAIVPEWKDASQPHNATIDRDIPRLLEQAILRARLGGRLLTRTRVPILKVCQRPTDELYTALFDERTKWDALSEEEKYPSSTAPDAAHHDPAEQDEKTDSLQVNDSQSFPTLQEAKAAGTTPRLAPASIAKVETEPNHSATDPPKQPPNDSTTKEPTETPDASKEKDRRNRGPRKWQRERKQGPLDFPKSGVGIQCDINFANPLALHNTHLLHCYSLTDPRVRPMILFVKAWAKRRKINSAYSGTLSSYGWVLMVLHYLVNIVSPPCVPISSPSGGLRLLRQKTSRTYSRRPPSPGTPFASGATHPPSPMPRPEAFSLPTHNPFPLFSAASSTTTPPSPDTTPTANANGVSSGRRKSSVCAPLGVFDGRKRKGGRGLPPRLWTERKCGRDICFRSRIRSRSIIMLRGR
ncbi:hypothetical protein GRF29_112g1561921 [Pseudopithomyces chartarum]|uniref:Poly(A) RNA polymerase mitochondrial-like central palm domain-containing protein n=1 Tax=Pseudopithomyces chartarum TaxID=1892770 RepID=A0AAN6LVI9_9PLEO|nr:hypothetical protein GRF29_112g1561921 [Pseudopithomyces chartarum]